MARFVVRKGECIEILNLVIMLLIAAGIGVLAVIVSLLLGPKKPSRAKLMPYESGNDPAGGDARQRFPVHFYLVAMLFILWFGHGSNSIFGFAFFQTGILLTGQQDERHLGYFL